MKTISFTRRLLLAAAVFGLAPAWTAAAADLGALTDTCAGCHGKDGASTDADVPVIGGMSPTYLEFNLIYYKRKERPCAEVEFKAGPDKGKKTTMCDVAKDLGEGDISQLAKFFAGRKFVKLTQPFDAELAEKGKAIHQEYCEKCHLGNGTDPTYDAGILAGQSSSYLRKTFDEFSAGTRRMEQKMKPKIQKLKKESFEALVNFYASVK